MNSGKFSTKFHCGNDKDNANDIENSCQLNKHFDSSNIIDQ